MADNNQLKASQIDFAHDDPFAELTRIMGFDPREPVRKAEPAPSVQPAAPQQQTPASFAQQPEEDDFSLDLEKELLGGFDFEDEPAQPAPNAAAAELEQDDFLPPVAPEPAASEPDFDFTADFDAAMASESFDAPVFDAPVFAPQSRFDADHDDAVPATARAPVMEDDFDLGLSDEDMQSLSSFDVAPAVEQADDSHLDLDLAAALSGFDTEHSPSLQAEAAPQPAAAGVEAEELDLDFFEADFQLADEDAPQAAAEPQFLPTFEEPVSELAEAAPQPASALRDEPGAEPELDESAFQFSDDEFRFEDLPAVENLAPAVAFPVEDPRHEEPAFDDLDFGDELSADDAQHDDFAAPAQEAPAPQAVEQQAAEPPAAPQSFEFSVPAFVPRKLPTSPMDIAAEEFRQREAVVAPQPEFNLEDELNALLGNSKPKASPEPAPLPTSPLQTVPVAAQSFEPSLGPAFQPFAPEPAAPTQFDAPEHPVELDDNLNWEFDDSFAAEAAPEQAEAYQTAEPAYDAAEYDAVDDLALDLDDVFDDLAETETEQEGEPAQPYRDAFIGGAAAASAARGIPDFAARPFEIPSFQPRPSYDAASSAHQTSSVSSHRDPVVRGDPLKEDPLNVIAQLAEQYSRKEPASYGRATGATPGYRDEEIEDDLDISYDFDDQPEIDTIEVTDRAVALGDDFDIPELPEEDHVPQAAAYDDIDAEFSSLLNELNAEQQAAQPVGYSDPLAGGFQPQPYQAAPQASRAYAQRPTASAAAPHGLEPEQSAFSLDMDDFAGNPSDGGHDGRHDRGGMHYADDYQFESEFDQDMMPGHLAEENSRRPIPRKLLIGGLIAGVALIGGLGAFAFSYGGGSSGAPELVRAEDGPVKIRPENPGGATVPNQEHKVYERVAGEGNTNGTGQENLVTTAEEPLDVTPPADDENIAVSGKGEDRIEQILQDTEGQSDAELAAVAPRKVRTMVVKPDGTLVEREDAPGTSNEQTDTIPAAAPPATEGIPGATQDVPALAPVPGETQVATAPPAPVASETTGSTPDTAPIAPLRPAEQPIDVVGEVKPDQVAAATTAAAAAGTWAMQIASQPSEAAAQSSYQDLARRYGSVLQGRNVNIVKAEIAGKGTFWRVRVPANTRNEAIGLCEQYKAAGGNCFVSR
jgi:hypothetical protein